MKEAEKNQENKEQSGNKSRRRRRSRNRNRSNHANTQVGQKPVSVNAQKSQRSSQAPARKQIKETKQEAQEKTKNTSRKEVTELLLPSAAALHEFEFAVEGGAERLLDIAKSEQEHRHNWENYALKSHIKSQRLGLLFGSFISLVTLFLVKFFADEGKEELAEVLSVSVFGFMAVAIIFNFLFASKAKA